MAFGLTPAGAGFPPQAPDSFPNYIQFQSNGVDLGLPNVDTVDFADGLVATRGTGESANKVTVIAGTNPSTPTPSGASTVAFQLSGSGAGGVSAWAYTARITDATVGAFNDSTDEFTFVAAGVYEVRVATRFTLGPGNVAVYGGIGSASGTGPDSLTSGSRHNVAGTQEQFDFVDVFLLSMVDGDLVRSFDAAVDNAEQAVSAVLAVIITRLS